MDNAGNISRRSQMLTKELHTEIEINAPAERVWQLLTDFDAYPQWNPFIRWVRGYPEIGERLEVHIQPSGARGMTFRPTVRNVEQNRELRWLGRLLVPGLFDGEHSFVIAPLEEVGVRFTQREVFRGLLVPVFSRGLARDTRRGFEEMNRALKEQAEAKPA